MSSIGIPNSATYAESLSGIEAMMSALPDNTTNEISGKDVRDVVFTLYESIQATSPTEFKYSNPELISNPIGNWTNTKTFSNVGLKEIFDGIFYKDTGPVAGLAFSTSIAATLDFRGIGTTEYITVLTTAGVANPSQASNSIYDELVGQFQLQWTATKKTYNLNPNGNVTRSTPQTAPPEVTVAGNPLFPIGSIPANGGTDKTGFTKLRVNSTNTFTFNFSDIRGNAAPQASLTVTYGVRFYWGRKSNNNPVTSSSEITSLDGAGLAGSGGFASTYKRSYDGINGAGQFLCFAYPTSFGGTPTFIINGLSVNAYTKVNSGFGFTNSFGYQIPYDVWVSNTAQNSPITKFQIT